VRLRAKWTLALLVTGALPLAALTLTTGRIQKRGLETAEKHLEVAVIDHVATVLERSLDSAAEATHRVGRMLTEATITSDDARLELAREAMARGTMLAQVAIYDGKGKLLDAINRVGVEASRPPPEITASAPAPNAAGQWLPPPPAAEGAQLQFLEPVFREGELRAWVLGTLQAHAIDTELTGISRDRFDGRPDGVLLLDEQGRVFAGGVGAFAPGTTLFGRDLFAETTLPPNVIEKGLGFSTEFTSASGESMIGSARVLPQRRWFVVVRRPAEAVYATIAATRRQLGIAAAASALLAVALGAFLAARTTRPIGALADLAGAYGRRELDKRSTVRTGDELEGLGTAMMRMADDIAEGEREIVRRTAVEANLSRYLPQQVAESIASGKQQIELGGERRVVTVLFADVVAFTPFAEAAGPERVVSFLNELFTVLSEVVFRHGGIIDKFIGDSLMAIFGAPTEQQDHASRALGAAEDMHRFVEASAPAWRERYGFDVKLAIGLSSGEVVVGNLGSETRMEYTAIGDVVNIAARLEALARPGQTLVVESTTAAAGDGWTFHWLGEQPLRGKRALVKVAEVA